MKKYTMKPEVYEKYRKKLVSPMEAVGLVKSGDCLYYGTNITTPYALNDMLAERENELENVKVIGASCYKPIGILSPDSKAFVPQTYYFGLGERVAQKGKYVDYTSCHLSETNQFVLNVAKPNIAFIPVSAPDEDGNMSFGNAGLVCGPYLRQIAETIVLVVNSFIPYMKSEYMINLDDATCLVEMDEELLEIPNLEPSEEISRISQFIADETSDGACIQMGIGDLATAVGFGLRNKNDLSVHSEMIGDSIMELIKNGNVTNKYKKFMPGYSTGVFLMGTRKLYEWADWNDGLRFVPSPVGNCPINIAKNDNVISVNTAMEIDLAGQIVADNIQGRQYSSIGGQLDYVLGAQLSRGGKSFIAMTSTYKKNGKLMSKITSRLKPGTFVTTPRSCVQYVVTEYGCVNLKKYGMHDRVLALISVAHPSFREELKDQARDYGLLPRI